MIRNPPLVTGAAAYIKINGNTVYYPDGIDLYSRFCMKLLFRIVFTLFFFSVEKAAAQTTDEWIQGKDGNANPIVHQGWYLQGGYFPWPKHLQGVFRYDVYDPDEAKSKNLETSAGLLNNRLSLKNRYR